MNAEQLLSSLRSEGLFLQAVEDRVVVRPGSRLTDQYRQLIRSHKTRLLQLLNRPPALTDQEQEAIAEAIEERAAIREFDGRQTRETAEREARSAMRVYRVLVAMRDGSPKWVTMIAPGCTPAEARCDACLQFGAERVLGIEVNQPARGKR